MIQTILTALLVAGSAWYVYKTLKPKKGGPGCSGCNRCGH